MTNTRIPAAPKDVGRLSLVLASAFESVRGKPNAFGLPKSKSVVVAMVDGLGLANLEKYAGHAPTLFKAFQANRVTMRTEVPSTTVLSITSLTTGLRAGAHGQIGYTVFDRKSQELVNLLSGWEQDHRDPLTWKNCETISERETDLVVVSQEAYRGSGFTALTTPNSEFFGEVSIDSRFATAAKKAGSGAKVIYLYIPELDQAGHRFGSQSNQWIGRLEELDAAFKKAIATPGVSWLLTGDHGMVDVSESGHVYLDQLVSLSKCSFRAAGDTRCSYLYFDNKEVAALVRSQLQEELGPRGLVLEWADLVTSGWQIEPIDTSLLPDLLVLARGETVFYDRRTAKPNSLKMIGHHGSFSDTETQVPLIRFGF